jgi:4-alpha-glucanotransferase
MAFHRASGVLLHPSSLPSPHGIGDLGKTAYEFVDFLAAAGQTIWQILPLGPTGFGNSPYMCFSAMAGNPMLISLEALCEQGLVEIEDLEVLAELSPEKVDFTKLIPLKTVLLQRASEAFKEKASREQMDDFMHFCSQHVHWLNDYALFMTLKDNLKEEEWSAWGVGLVEREPKTIERYERLYRAEIFCHKFMQYIFFDQWKKLRQYANERSISLLGDIPIYVAYNSSDVWAHPELFYLEEDTYKSTHVAGVPPDYFSETGQLWGNPLYNWEKLKSTGYSWWIDRFKMMLNYVDMIRVDHFRAFESYWSVPSTETTAMDGTWEPGPGEDLFMALEAKLGTLPILAEDLGVITPDVEALRDQFNFPGMKILEFSFGSGAGNPYLPHNYGRNFAVYTGTHDNDTAVGWFSQLSEHEQESVKKYLGHFSPDGIHWDLIRLAFMSIADLAIIPLQDLLGLDGQARMNFPSTTENNWIWRYQQGDLSEQLAERLGDLSLTYGRTSHEIIERGKKKVNLHENHE